MGIALVLVAVLSAGGSNEQPGLAIERLAPVGGGIPELVIYVQDRAKNVPDSAGGSRSVTVECLDKRGKVLVRAPQTWPFGYPDGEQLDPHVHQPVQERQAALVTRCRLKGTKPLLEGKIGGPTVR